MSEDVEIKKVMINQEEYPRLLREIKDPPQTLYYRGDISLLKKRCIAVVGSRKTSDYGKWAAYKIGSRMAEHDMTVVSGMAIGIDSYAHKGTLAKKGSTVAVLGCGTDICYPEVNGRLKEQIEKNGLVVSEYPKGHPPSFYTFPRRNRIISGMSEAVVVISAGLNSGALITAELAADQGRDVYAVPGNINSIYNMGSNKLIRDGAIMISKIDDLLDDLSIKRKETEEVEAALGPEEKTVFGLIAENGEVTADYLCRKTGKKSSYISGIVTVLEMKGVVETSSGKIFVAK
ncbi:MAG TPA: DNA-processing protein DprA [Bacillota bacterium]|nr:DNA-processing protein DprA [Bacillota bacterium]